MSVTAGGGASPLTNQARRKTPVSVRRRTLVLMKPLEAELSSDETAFIT